MQKVIAKDFRQVKEIKLPTSGLTLECYSSILVRDLAELTEKGGMNSNVEVVVKCIKSWNLFENETDEHPLPITPENFSRIPATDFQYLVQQLELFASGVKKN